MGIRLTIADPAEFDLILSEESPKIFRAGVNCDDLSLVFPRLGASVTNYGLAVISQFEMMGVNLLNDSQSLSRTRNKLTCIQALSQNKISIPRTAIIRQPGELKNAVAAVGGFPIVLKLLSGTQGIGVMLVEDSNKMETTIDTLWSLGQDILLQECVKESLGRDIRVLVLDGKVMGAIRRQARIGDFRANANRGAVTTSLDLSDIEKETAVNAAKAMGLTFAGVDILESNDGPKVIEVNASPSIEGLENTTGVNLASKILTYALNRCMGERS